MLSISQRAFRPRLALCCAIPLSIWLAGASPARAQVSDAIPTLSNYGGAGLLDTRSARFLPDGSLALSTSITTPDDRYAMTFQALPWAETTFRYSVDRAFPAGGISLHDRSFDLKLRLSNETENIPELALGFQDVLGTGVYSGEYFVGTKNWGPFDVSLGIGWGRLGSSGMLENPFSLLSDHFRTRPIEDVTGQGGIPLFSSYFRGPDAGLFGGIEYKTPIPGLTLEAEYSSDAYAQEKLLTGKDYSFPVNVGVNYRAQSWLDVGLSLMHGRDLGFKLSAVIDPTSETWVNRLDPAPKFQARTDAPAETMIRPANPAPAEERAGEVQTNFIDLTAQRAALDAQQKTPSPAVPPTPSSAVNAAPAPDAAPQSDGARAADIGRMKAAIEGQKLIVIGLNIADGTVSAEIENNRYRRDTEAIARTARVLSRTAAPDIEYFVITSVRAGQPLTTVTLLRNHIDSLARRLSSPDELFLSSSVEPAKSIPADHMLPDIYPRLSTNIYPVFEQSLFDPDKPYRFEIGVGASASLEVARGLFVEGAVAASLYDDFDTIDRTSNSVLPHVRSDFANYLKKGKYGIAALSGSYYFKLAPEIYGRVTAGYLEQMFAGAGGEVLYRPFGQRWALGADLWTVRQRGFDDLLDLRRYQALTGHISAYYDLPWHDIQLGVHAGQYLAGDKGFTFEATRRFSTGVQVGAWFTLTNVSSQQFGEGSFDKGIRIIIPMEWVTPFASQGGYDLELRPIQRDGGQRLGADSVLYGMTNPSDYGAVTEEWGSVFKR